MVGLRRVLILLSGLLSFGASAWAEPYPDLSRAPEMASTGADDIAIVVAVEDYLLLPAVRGARQTGADWEVFFRKGLGVRDVRVLYDKQATREDILTVAGRAAAKAEAGATLWFVFVGHGAPSSGGDDALVLGMDTKATARSLETRGVPRSELVRVLEASKAQPVLILDACFSGKDTVGGPLISGLQPDVAIKPVVTQQALVLSAASAGQFAGDLPGAQRPAFSYLLLGGLRGWADSDGDGNVTSGEANRWTSTQLEAVTTRVQTPELAGATDKVLSWKVEEKGPDISAIVADHLRGPIANPPDKPNAAFPALPDDPTPKGCADGTRMFGDECYTPQHIRIRSRHPNVQVAIGGRVVGKTDAAGRFSSVVALADNRVQLRDPARGVVVEAKCDSPTCDLDFRDKSRVAVSLNPVGVFVLFADLLSIQIAANKLVFSISGDAGTTGAAKWYGATARAVYSGGPEAWSGPYFGASLAYRRATYVETGEDDLLSFGGLLGLRRSWASGFILGAHASVGVGLSLGDDGAGPALGAGLDAGYAF